MTLRQTLGRRSRIVSAVLVVLLLSTALVFRRHLVAWFTGTTFDTTGAPVAVEAGPFSVEAALDPDPPVTKGNTLDLEVRDTSGQPVDGATVDVGYDMPAMGTMPEMKGRAKVVPERDGRYRAEFDLPMSGGWTLLVTIQKGVDSGSRRFGLTTGIKGLSPAGSIESGSPTRGAEVDHYTCSMHPTVKQQAPGKCPVCGMDLVPVTRGGQAEGVVIIDETRRQRIGVRTAPVIEGPFRATFRAVGRVAYDERALSDVNLKVRGWITRLMVNQAGQRVGRGQTLFTLYSPELYQAQLDFLLATRGATGPDAGPPRVESFGRAARQRLQLLGMPDEQINAVASHGAAMESVPIPSPASGFVIEKSIVEGASVEPGMRLYRIAALHDVWVEADVYEADLPNVHVGQEAKVTLDYVPDRTYDGKVRYVYPYLDEKARTGKVRLELPNARLELRPGMYATVQLTSDVRMRVQVPVAAIVYTGPRRLVFLDLGEGRFRPQEVQLGAEGDGMYEVLSGLKAGDIVATSGVFLIAAEARISTAVKYWEPNAEAQEAGTEGGSTNAAPHSPADSGRSTWVSPTHQPSPPTSDAAVVVPRPASSVPVGYACPMHPEVRSPTPGKCPKCGMDLQPQSGQP